MFLRFITVNANYSLSNFQTRRHLLRKVYSKPIGVITNRTYSSKKFMRRYEEECNRRMEKTPWRDAQKLLLLLLLLFGPKRDEVTGEWRRLHNKELYALYSLPNIIWVIKSRRMGLAVHVVRMGIRRGWLVHTGIWWGNLKEGTTSKTEA